MKRIIVNVVPEETRMAIVADGELQELALERAEAGNVVGNIYKGRVKNVLPGMQAAFVDIGREKNAFLYIGDAFSQTVSASIARQPGLTAGQEILVQIVKDAIGTKGPRATTHLTLPGRYVVLMPTVDYIGISRRIEDAAERERLKEIAGRLCPAGMGMIVRTVAVGEAEAVLKKDIDYLANLWNALSARSRLAAAPALLYRDADLVIRLARDYIGSDTASFVIDNKEAWQRVRDLMAYAAPEYADKVTLYQGEEDIFSYYRLAEEIAAVGRRRVALRSGGHLVIDKTEALTVVDVNTGKFVGRTNLADTVFKTNLEAAEEIARQLRLRDIGGIIVVDFIDMEEDAHRQAVLRALEEKTREDKTKTNIVGITGLGLVEITRKKARQNFEAQTYCECPYCCGRGRVKSPETVAIEVSRKLRRLAAQKQGSGGFLVQTHPAVNAVLAKNGAAASLSRETGRPVTAEAVETMHPEAYSILHGEA